MASRSCRASHHNDPAACENVSNPALTKPMTVRIAAVEDCTSAVKTTPDAMTLNRPEISLWSASQGVARKILKAVSEVMDSKQEQAETTEDGYGG